jgi:hypothetical protein
LAASEEKVALVRQELTAEMESNRKLTLQREAEVAATLEAERQDHTRTVTDLSAELAASRETTARLRERVAELQAGSLETRPAPGSTAPEDSGLAAWRSFAVAIALLVLAGLVAVAIARRRSRLPGTAPMPQPSPGESAEARALGVGAIPTETPAPGSEVDMTPQKVVEALRRGDVPLFEGRFAKLAGLRAGQLNRILYGTTGEELAILCRALGMDKLFLASIFLLSHKDQPAESKVGPRDLSRVTAFYDRVTEDSAREVLEQWRRDPGLPGVIERLRGSSGRGDAPGRSGAAE